MTGTVAVDPPLDHSLRRFLLVVAVLTAYVTFWGYLFPSGVPGDPPGFAKSVDDALPFNITIPPLHARFIGAFYGAATLLLVAAARRGRRWTDVRIVTWIVFVWTGILGVVSFLHLEIFDWSRPPFVAWFLAYVGFPAYAARRLWGYRSVPAPADDGTMPAGLRAALLALACGLIPLGVALFLAPEAMAAVWPWKLPPILAVVYSAPFLGFGVAAALAARAGTWREVRIFVVAAVAFAAAALAASVLHRPLFDPARLATWVWFGGLVVVGLVLARYAAGRSSDRI